MKKNEDHLRDLWDNIKQINICIIGFPEGEEREKRPEKILEEIIAESFPNMGEETINQVQEAQRVPGKNQGGAHQDKHSNQVDKN